MLGRDGSLREARATASLQGFLRFAQIALSLSPALARLGRAPFRIWCGLPQARSAR